MTRARESILQVLKNATQPLSATDVANRTTHRCDQATIYRTLHYLEDHGYAQSFVLHCSEHGTERYYTAIDDDGPITGHHHWFHCQQCHTFIDLGDCRIESMLNGYEEELGLKVKTHTLYVTGICASCMRSGNTDSSSSTVPH